MPEEDEVTLYDYIKAISKRKWLIIIGTFACILTVAVVTLFLPKVYETRATLTMVGPDTSDVKVGVLRIPTGLSLENFFNFLVNDRDLHLEVIRKLGLDKSPDNLTPQALSRIITFSLAEDRRMITINVRYNHPKKAKNIADTMAEVVKNHYKVLKETEVSQSQSLIDEHLNLVKASLVEAEKNLQSYNKTVDLDSLRKEIKTGSSQETKLAQEYSMTTTLLIEQEARLARTQEELKKIDTQIHLVQANLVEAEANLEAFNKIVDLDSLKKEIRSRSSQQTTLAEEYSKIRMLLIEQEARLARAQEELQKQDKFYVVSKGESQQINPIYQNLEEIVTNAQISIAGARAKELHLKEKIEENKLALSKLRRQLAEKESEWQSLREVYNLAKKEYQSIGNVHQLEKTVTKARISIAGAKTKEPLLKEKIEENKLALSKLRTQLAEIEPEEKRLIEVLNLAKMDYRNIRNTHRNAAQLLAVAKARQLKTVSTAAIPTRPIERKTKQILLVAAIVGLLASLVLAFFLEYLEKMRGVEGKLRRQED